LKEKYSVLSTIPIGALSFVLSITGRRKTLHAGAQGDHGRRKIISGPQAPIEIGNALPLDLIPHGLNIHNIELKLGRGGQLVRSAGSSAVIVAKEGDYVTIRLPSGETRMVFKKCYATIGELSNEDNMNISLGKAGRSRWLGHRPKPGASP